MSAWTLRELINGGLIPVARVPRPRTPGALRRQPQHEHLRMIRLDRAELDRFVDERCGRERLTSGWNE